MNQQFTVLLHSQYSPSCKRLLDGLQQSPVDLASVAGLSTLCIDNEEVRARITASTQIDVQVVPCILVVHPEGGVEKYDGPNAFKWAEEVIRRHAPPPAPQPQAQPPPPQQPPPVQLEDQEGVEPYYPPQRPQQRSRQPAQEGGGNRRRRPPAQAPPPEPIPQAGTAIEDIPSDDEDDYAVPPRPPAGMRVDPGNYEQGEFGAAQEPNRQPTHGIRTSTQPTQGGKVDIMAAAQAMQKDRDMDFERQRPVGMPRDR